MKQVLMIKYAELTTKKGNRSFFVKTLKKNVDAALADLEYTLDFNHTRMYIYTSSEEVINRLLKVFGIHEIDLGYIIEDNELDNIKEKTLEVLKKEDFKTFKVETKRSLKTYPIKSMEISRLVGAHLLKNIKDIKVDVNNPDIVLNIEVRNNVVFYYKTYKGLGGYPVGVQGKGLLMLSGGIDSPVASYLMTKRGVKPEYIYFDSPPHTSEEAKKKVISLAEKLVPYSGETKIHVINFTKIQESILRNCPHEYLITIMRRFMYRLGAELANDIKANALFNGENIGQVASQTLTSMKVINDVTSFPVVRPLATYDKLEIIELAKQIETYEISILPYEDCCTVFVPKHPVINPNLKLTREYESVLDINSLVKEAIENKETIIINSKKTLDELL